MITVYYQYRKNGKWTRASKEFSEPRKAVNFMYAIRRKHYFIESYSCIDIEDSQYIEEHFKGDLF